MARTAAGKKPGQMILMSLVALCGGCASLPKRSLPPSVDHSSLNDATFLHYLASTPVVTVSEGTRGVLLLRGSTEQWPEYRDQYDELLRIGAVKAQWALSPEDTLDMGTLAYMLRTICDLSPSVSERMAQWTGLGDRRYALRRCVDEGLLPYAPSGRAVRGGELVAALTRAEAFVASPTGRNAAKAPANTP